MKIVHLSDLHIGKNVNSFSMLEDQKFIFSEILNIIDLEKPDAVLIAGDIYDKSIPTAEAVTLFDNLLYSMSMGSYETFITSGNHDSAERIAFGSRIMENSGIHLSPVYDGNVKPVTLQDQYGNVNFYMLPFVKPVYVRNVLDNAKNIVTYTDAVKAAIENMNVDRSERNILICHQFVTGSEKSGSEEISVGGSDNVDKNVFESFDYTALGHIHGAQNVSPRIRYCGTPLKYSISEENHIKSVTVVEIGEKGSENIIRTVPLTPKRDMRTIEGKFSEIYNSDNATEDYVAVVLTDENDIPNAPGKLRTLYPHMMSFEYKNKRTLHERENYGKIEIENKSELELFEDLYEKQNGSPMSGVQRKYMQNLIEEILEEKDETY